MAPIGHSIVPLRFRDSFFRDPYFSDSWDIIERQKTQFERDCEEAREKVFGKSSIGHNPNATSLSAFPNSTSGLGLADYFKSTSGVNGSSALSSGISGLSSTDNEFKTEKENYKVVVDVAQFKPEELCVKTSDDKNTIIIEGKHEEKKEGSSSSGYISRQFTRKYTLPSDVELDSLQCNLSSDGILQLTAPRTKKSITDATNVFEKSNGSNSSIYGHSHNAVNSSNNSSLKKDVRETMTVDGRKIDNATNVDSADSKHNNYSKWKEGRGEVAEDYDNLHSSKTATTTSSSSTMASNNVSNGDAFRDAERIHSDNSIMSRMKNWDPFFRTLPDFDMVPFLKRRSEKNQLFQLQENSLMGIQSDLDNFKVLVDVKQFTPEELSVRCTDQFVVIEGKHEDKEDSYGSISRHFTRKYDLPYGVKASDVQCNLTAAGILELKAPKPKHLESEQPKTGRKVPILMNNHQKVSSSSSSSEEVRKESSTGPTVTHRISPSPVQQLREQRQESVESSMSSGGNNRRVTIQELSRSSSNNSNYNDHVLHSNGEHVIPITIAAH